MGTQGPVVVFRAWGEHVDVQVGKGWRVLRDVDGLGAEEDCFFYVGGDEGGAYEKEEEYVHVFVF